MSPQAARLRAEPAARAARMLRLIHDAYRAQQAEAQSSSTEDLRIEERHYRSSTLLLYPERARYRAIREELLSRGVQLEPLPSGRPRPRRPWRKAP